MGILNFFKKKPEQKASKTSIAVMPAGGGVVWQPRQYDVFAAEAYIKNAVAFACIDKIAKSVSSVPWAVYERDSGGNRIKIPNDPMMDLIRRPNPQESWSFLMQKLTGYFALSGNGYLERVAPETGPNRGVPKELYVLRPDYTTVHINDKTGLIDSFIF